MNTVKIKIRPLELSDKIQLAKLANNKKVWDNLKDHIPFPYNESDAEYFINLTKNNKFFDEYRYYKLKQK